MQQQLFGGAEQFFGQAQQPTTGREQEIFERLRAVQTPEEQRQRLALGRAFWRLKAVWVYKQHSLAVLQSNWRWLRLRKKHRTQPAVQAMQQGSSRANAAGCSGSTNVGR